MNELNKTITDFAISLGFNKVEIIDVSSIEFDPVFQEYCKQNLCGNYNKNYSCPPTCGTAKEMIEKVLSYKNAIVLEKRFIIDDLKDSNKIKELQIQHNKSMFEVKELFNKNNISTLLIGASHCTHCNPCKLQTNQPCSFINLRFSCMSAYCIHVKKLADKCNMNYEYKENTLSLYGMLLFNKN